MSGFAAPASAVDLSVLLQIPGGDFVYLAIVFFVLAIIAALVGFQGVAGISMDVAKILIFVFIVLAVVSLLL